MSEQIKHHIETQKQKVLTDREQARLRLPVFFGSFDSSFHAFIEQLMNARDELFNHNNGGEVHITLDEDMKTVTVQDNGRGILIHGIDEDTNKPNYELVFETLFSGGNYDNAYSDDLIETIGGNGCGNSTTAYSSLYFQATEFKNNKAYQITYHNGCLEKEYKEFDSPDFEHGTRITYILDDNVYTTNVYNPKDMFNQIRRVSGTSNNIKYYFHHNNETTEFLFDSYEDYVDDTNTNKLTNNIHFPLKNYEIKAKKDGKEFLEKDRIEVIISLSTEPVQETYLNGGYLPEQGTFYKGIVEGIRKFLQKDIKDKKVKLTDNDIIMSFNIYGIMGSNNPVYSNQTKRASSNEAYKKLASQYIIENMEVFKHENPKTYQQIIEHITQINKFNEKSESSRRAISKALKEKATNCTSRPPKLVPCRSKNPKEISIAFLEGDSALNSVKLGRNAYDTMVYPLKGKPINAMKTTLDKVLANQEIKDMYKIFGCGMEYKGKPIKGIEPFNIDNLQVAEILLICDEDEDGRHLRDLAVGDIYTLSPELIKRGIVKIVQTPLYIIKTKSEEIYAYSEQERREIISKLNIPYKEKRFKGLGGHDVQTMHKCLDKETRRVIVLTMEDGEESVKRLKFFLEEDVEPRKQFILEHANEYSSEEIYV